MSITLSDIFKQDAYGVKLRDPRWHALRSRIIAKRGGFCENCKQKKPLQLHHNFYDRGKEPWDYEERAFRVLCFDCHERFTSALVAFRRDGLAYYDVRSVEVLAGALSAVPKHQPSTLTFAYAVAWLAAHPDLSVALCEKWQQYQNGRGEEVTSK